MLTLLVAVFVSQLLDSMAVDRFTFESPDEVGNLEDAGYMLTNPVPLLIGSTIGGLLGGRLAHCLAPPG